MPEVRKNPEAGRYELVEEGRTIAIADYVERGDAVVFPHTEVVAPLRGQGYGEQLVRAALDDLRSTGRHVVPACWFVAEFIGEHDEYRDLVA